MIYTARQLQELQKTNGHVTLPVGSRLTPLAQDWSKQKNIAVVFGESVKGRAAILMSSSASHASRVVSASPSTADAVLWWCDGPCGQAKAAIAAQARETQLEALTVTADPKYLVAAIKAIAKEV